MTERRYELGDAAVRFRGRDRETIFGESGEEPATFFEKQFRFTPVFSPIYVGSHLTVKTADFYSFSFAGAPDGLRIFCGVPIRKSLNSAGLERDFFRQKQAFQKSNSK